MLELTDMAEAPAELESRRRSAFWPVVVVMAIVAAGVFVNPMVDSLSTKQDPSPIAAPQRAAIEVSKEQVQAFQLDLNSRGFNCLEFNIVYDKGSSIIGRTYKVYCGPANRPGMSYADPLKIVIDGNGYLHAMVWN